MINLARGVVVLVLTGVFVAFIYAQTGPELALIIANDSQLDLTEEVTSNIGNIVTSPTPSDETKGKKLVEKTVLTTKTNGNAEATATGKSLGAFSATAYCLQGKTASGAYVRRGLIAADPRVLRLGSKVNIGAGAYSGDYLVADIGGGIKGRKIDIWMASCAEARRFGRRTVNISLQ